MIVRTELITETLSAVDWFDENDMHLCECKECRKPEKRLYCDSDMWMRHIERHDIYKTSYEIE